MPIQCYSNMVMGGLLVIVGIVKGSWEAVGGGIAAIGLGAAGLPWALRLEREGPIPKWRERGGVWERVEPKRPRTRIS